MVSKSGTLQSACSTPALPTSSREAETVTAELLTYRNPIRSSNAGRVATLSKSYSRGDLRDDEDDDNDDAEEGRECE